MIMQHINVKLAHHHNAHVTVDLRNRSLVTVKMSSIKRRKMPIRKAECMNQNIHTHFTVSVRSRENNAVQHTKYMAINIIRVFFVAFVALKCVLLHVATHLHFGEVTMFDTVTFSLPSIVIGPP